MTKKCHWNTKIRVYEAGVTSKTHTSHLECVYVQVYLLFRLQSERSKFHHWKWITNFRVFILFSLDKLQWNKKNLFSRSIQMSILANSKWAGHKSSKCKLKMCYKTKKNVNLIFGHCCCFSHRIHLVSTIEMQQHLNKINNIVHFKITCRIFDPSLNNKTTVNDANHTKGLIFEIIDSLMKYVGYGNRSFQYKVVSIQLVLMRTQAVKPHKKFDHFKKVCSWTRKTFWENIFHSLSQARETLHLEGTNCIKTTCIKRTLYQNDR